MATRSKYLGLSTARQLVLDFIVRIQICPTKAIALRNTVLMEIWRSPRFCMYIFNYSEGHGTPTVITLMWTQGGTESEVYIEAQPPLL